MWYKSVGVIISIFIITVCITVKYDCKAGDTTLPADMIKITATIKSAPPEWAIMERYLIDTMNAAAPEFLNKYADRGGRMPSIGKPDDIYEVFGNWPLFYIIGGSEEIFELSLRQWDAITRQLTYGKSKRVDREFVMNYDWFHNSESYKYFYYFGLADPLIPENIDRAKRFAAMYMG